ncbi:hypothetical protein N7532_007700 [Penicillium argentinense]|uniref:Ankyrin repeat protein n=1 Tax=Penicillium argentinense TaxID=1131581 RepID=A0A9W9EW80_9EURO|nr:uncharacterized protein N7532_007700 [Penicillium argentinense]KAJ5089016.1 hypothetical protein N7532_007700 [Penicillium argentinense]
MTCLIYEPAVQDNVPCSYANEFCSSEETALLTAIMSCYLENERQLLKAGADPIALGQSGESAFELSVYCAEDPSRHERKEAFQEITKLFLETLRPAGLKWFARLNTRGLSPLCWAACHNAIDVMRYLLDSGENVNQQSCLGMTPLHCSAECDREEACRLLAQKDIEVEKKDHHGATAIHHAAKNGHGDESVAQRLLAENTERDIAMEVIGYDPRTRESSSVLHNAVRHCSLEIVRRLLVVRFLIYTIPELIKPDILSFEIFKSEMLTRESYVEEATELYDCGYPADKCPPYMVIYETLRTICENQQEIVENRKEINVLSVLAALPRTTEIELDFPQSIDEPQWVDSYLSLDMTAKEVSNTHHLQAITKALQRRPESRASLVTIELSSLHLPYYSPWELPNFSALSDALERLLEQCTTLRITERSASLELLLGPFDAATETLFAARADNLTEAMQRHTL